MSNKNSGGLTEDQQLAFDEISKMAFTDTDNQMAVLNGYAGTGKTYLVAQLIKMLTEDDILFKLKSVEKKVFEEKQMRYVVKKISMPSIAIAAPTNKALKVLKEKIPSNEKVHFATIHKLLGLKAKEKDNGTVDFIVENEPSLDEYQFVVIDECSMINREIYKMILTYKGNARILFVGDSAQLPPIGENNHSVVFEFINQKFTLSKVVRQAADNPIIKTSMMIRKKIEENQRTNVIDLTESLPPMKQGVKACIASDNNLVQWSLYELKQKRDCRIVAFTNQNVKKYNKEIHESLYPDMPYIFTAGEQVVVHETHDPFVVSNGEELTIILVDETEHPKYPDIPTLKITVKKEDGEKVDLFVAKNQDDLDQRISHFFKQWGYLSSQSKAKFNEKKQLEVNKADYETISTVDTEARKLKDLSKKASAHAWGLKKTFANIRHVYAITAHKSQGSTFDTALVDFNDLSKMQDSFQFNRALYVAITRPSDFLAIVA